MEGGECNHSHHHGHGHEEEGVDVDPTRRVRSYDNRVGAVGMYAPNPGGFELRSVLPGEEYLADASESTRSFRKNELYETVTRERPETHPNGSLTGGVETYLEEELRPYEVSPEVGAALWDEHSPSSFLSPSCPSSRLYLTV